MVRNTATADVRAEVDTVRALDSLEHRADVGVLVLSGEGSARSAGIDL